MVEVYVRGCCELALSGSAGDPAATVVRALVPLFGLIPTVTHDCSRRADCFYLKSFDALMRQIVLRMGFIHMPTVLALALVYW